jgi:hypothetical protein
MNKEKCLIYSVGSAGDFRFEMGIVKMLGTKACEIHVFDPTDYSHKVPSSLNDDVIYHFMGAWSPERCDYK